MPRFILAFHGGKQPASPAEGAKQMEHYKNWLDKLGDAIAEPGMPLGASKVVSPDGVNDRDTTNRCMGLQFVNADNLDAALAMAQACPFLDTGGTIEVTEVMSLGKR